jgi:hypothetical protein
MKFPLHDREKSADLVLEGALAVFGALHSRIADLGGDKESRHLFCYAVAKAVLEITDQPTKRQRVECNLIATRVSEFITSRAREERAEQRAADELEREKRKIIRLEEQTRRINAAFGHSSTGGGGRGPNDAA